jgi:hypothetical protein
MTMMYRSSLGALSQREVLPSSESVQAAIRGEEGAVVKVVVSTALRSLFIMPGMALVGVRGGKLIAGSLLSSATITAMLFLFYRKTVMSEVMPQNADEVLAEATVTAADTIGDAIRNAELASPGMQGPPRRR